MDRYALTNQGDSALEKAQWQDQLFTQYPDRLSLMRMKALWPCRDLSIHVHRNHSFEHLASVASAYFAYADMAPQYEYGDYDDSLTFNWSKGKRAGLELIWLDVMRYPEAFRKHQLGDWLRERLLVLRAQSLAPILVVAVPAQGAFEQIHRAIQDIPGARVADTRPTEEQLGATWNDPRAARYSGTSLSDRALILLARDLACRWVPALNGSTIKAIAVDLDHTLYEGVLGEDRDAIRLTNGHAELQKRLQACRRDGVFLALISRNEEIDVRRLFDRRVDFPLRWSDFSATAISWGSKAEGLWQIAKALHIGADAVLLLDDNPGELVATVSQVPGLRCIHAKPDPWATQAALEYAPGLWQWERGLSDALRVADLESDQIRIQHRQAIADPMDYLRSLQVLIKVEVAPRQHLKRLHELAQKTNQFNLNLKRFSEAEIASRLASPDGRIASISLRDRLSDSGVVGMLVARRTGDCLIVDELAISCRALGRDLENVMIAAAVNALMDGWPCRRLEFCYGTGPRNAPARDWLSKLSDVSLNSSGCLDVWAALRRIDMDRYPVKVETCR